MISWGDFWLDVDQFAERDFPNNPDSYQNDLDHPDNAVIEGDIFANNHYAFQRSGTLWGTGRIDQKRFSVYVGGHARYTSMWREGLMRKGLFPETSLGESENLTFSPGA